MKLGPGSTMFALWSLKSKYDIPWRKHIFEFSKSKFCHLLFIALKIDLD